MRKGFTLIELMIVIAIIAIIAAIAIPNLMESRVTANEAAAGATLKSGVFPAQVQFQAGSYQDIDVNNVGEYGTLGALAGLVSTAKLQFQGDNTTGLKLLQGALANGSSWTAATDINAPAIGNASGYFFTSYVGSETDAAGAGTSVWFEGSHAPQPIGGTVNTDGYVTNGTFKTLVAPAVPVFGTDATATASNGNYFIVSAAPQKYGDTGRRLFAITQDGQVRSPAKAQAINLAYQSDVGTAPTAGQPMTAAKLAVVTAYALDAVAYTPNPAVAPTVAPSITMFDTDDATKQTGTAYWEIYSK